MKAQDYADKYLPKIKEAKDADELTHLAYQAFVEFNEEGTSMIKARNAVKNDAVVSIIKEIGQKWRKFCKILNQQQEITTFNEDLFIDYWKEQLHF